MEPKSTDYIGTKGGRSQQGSLSVFWRLVSAFFISSVGDWLYKIALPLLVFEITGSAIEMAGAFALTFLPFVLVSLFGGVIADRYQRKRVLIWCDLAAGLLLVLIALVGAFLDSMPLLYILIFLAACLAPIHHPSFQAFIPEVVPNALLPRANAIISGSENIILIAAPILGGAFVGYFGATTTILINAGSFLASALLIASLKITKRKIKNYDQSVKDILLEGFQFAWSHPVLKYGALLFIGSNFAINLFQANLMFYLVDILNTPAPTIGVTFAIIGAGALLGAFIAPYFIDRFTPGKIIVTSTMLAGLFTFPLLLADDALTVGLIWAVESLFSTINMITYFTLRQRAVPSHILGRTVAITRLISYSSIPIAALCGGILLAKTNIGVIIILCGSIRLATGVWAVFSPLARYQIPINTVSAKDVPT